MMDRFFHILSQASSNHLPIAAKKPRLEAALPCMPIADILRPTHGTYLLDAWYIPQRMTGVQVKALEHPPEREKCIFYVELTSFGTDIFCHKATRKFIFHFQPRERRMKVASFWHEVLCRLAAVNRLRGDIAGAYGLGELYHGRRAPFVATELRSRGRRWVQIKRSMRATRQGAPPTCPYPGDHGASASDARCPPACTRGEPRRSHKAW